LYITIFKATFSGVAHIPSLIHNILVCDMEKLLSLPNSNVAEILKYYWLYFSPYSISWWHCYNFLLH